MIGAFFRQIHRADELGSGMRNMMKYGKSYGGADPELIEGDMFRIIVKVPEFSNKAQSSQIGKVTQQVTQQVKKIIAKTHGEMSRADLMAELSLKDRVNFSRNYLDPALDHELIEMTHPEAPQSPTQKYRLTDAGKRLLATMQSEAQ